METPDKANFNVLNVSIPSGGGINVKYKYSITMRNEFHEIEDIHQSSVEPHPDLQAKIRALKDYHLDVTRIKDFYKACNSDRFEANESQKKVLDAILDEYKRAVRITKLSISGKEDNVGVIITGVVEAITGHGMALNTCRVKLEEDIYGWEEDLKELVEDIESECYQYIFEGKVAEPDMFAKSLAGDDEESGEEVKANENFENETE